MKGVLLWFAAVVLAGGQTAQTWTYNGTGERVRGTDTAANDGSRSEWTQSINGRRVPLEQVEERVLRSDGQTKVVERLTHRFDADGHPATTERVVEEKTTLADGSSSVRATTYRNDVNGNMQVAERSVTETRKSGTTQNSEVVVERPSIDGSPQISEKRVTQAEESAARDVKSTTVYRRDDNGRFYEAGRETQERQTTSGGTVENSAKYAIGSSGRLELSSQTVKTSAKRADGSETIVVDVYTQETPGLANAAGGTPKLKEQQVIERTASQGRVTEVMSLRQPSMNDPDRLGPARKIRETVCQGKCDQ